MLQPALTTALILVGLLGLALISGGAGSLPQPPAETSVQTLGHWVDAVAAETAQAADDPAADGQVQGRPGAWQFAAFGRPVLVLADPNAGRMRVMTPVLDAQGDPPPLNEAAVRRVLEANFDTALDARYALHDGQLWSTYLHPLPTLTAADFRSGVIQTLNLAHSFGTTYSSTDMKFGGEADDADPNAGPEQII